MAANGAPYVGLTTYIGRLVNTHTFKEVVMSKLAERLELALTILGGGRIKTDFGHACYCYIDFENGAECAIEAYFEMLSRAFKVTEREYIPGSGPPKMYNFLVEP